MARTYMRQGDCIELMQALPDASIDLILCDLPYGTTQNKWDSVIPFEPLWAQYRRVCKPNAAIVLTASQPFTSAVVMSNLRQFKCEWIWQKNAGSNFGSTKFQPMKEHESVLVFSRDTPSYNPIMQERSEAGKRAVKRPIASNTKSSPTYRVSLGPTEAVLRNELRVPSSVQKFNRERGLHPTQKPVALMEYLIRTYTNEGMTVLDNCMGSGTTGVACMNLGRNFIGFEKDETYFAAAKTRVLAAKNELGLPNA